MNIEDIIKRSDELEACYHESSMSHNWKAERWIEDACDALKKQAADLARYKRLYEAAWAECNAAADEIDEWDCGHEYERAVHEHTRLRAELGVADA